MRPMHSASTCALPRPTSRRVAQAWRLSEETVTWS